MYEIFLEVSIMILISIAIIGLVLGFLFLIWRIDKLYFVPIRQGKRVIKLKRYISYISNLPDSEKAQVDINDLKKKKEELDSLVPQIEPGYVDSYDIDNSIRVKEFIDNLIMAEVTSELRNSMALKQKYDVLNFDKAIGEISTKILTGLNPELLTTRMIWTPDYLIQYITKQTTTILIHTALDWNRTIL